MVQISTLSALSLFVASTVASATVTHVYDRSSVYANIEMTQVTSSGESLANGAPIGPPPHESSTPDLTVQVRWADGTTSGPLNWSLNSGKDLTDTSPVLYPNVAVPGVSFKLPGDTLASFVDQSGDTFILPWEIRNLSSAAINQVVFSALGTPDMGFDTDNGSNPINGAGGFPLYLVTDSHDLTVTYDWFNNWNKSTDMFHRMTLDFDSSSLLQPNQSLAFYQDTDELYIPEPGTLALFGLAFAGLAALRQRRQ